MIKSSVVIFILLIIACSNKPIKEKIYTTENKIFNADSSFIVAKDLFPFLVEQKLVKGKDTINSVFKSSDTLGKFYRNGNEITLCFEDYNLKLFDFETHVIADFEVNEIGKIKFKRKTRYFHGNYSCCWNNFDGFIKKGDYFFIKTCGTGSGYCDGTWHIYQKEYKNNPNAEGFLDNMLSCMDSDTCMWISSNFQLHNNNIKVDYTSWDFIYDTLEADNMRKFNPSRYQINYELINHNLIVKDTIKL